MPRAPLITKLSDRFGNYTLVLTCRKCKHGRRTDPQSLAKILGWQTPLTHVAARMRCSNCGAKECDLTIDEIWRPRGTPKNPH